MGFESMPTGKPAKTEEEIEASRHENARQFEEQADTRNENRGVVKKVFGIGKESGIDIAQEEASRINRLVDQKIEREGAETSAQTASEEIAGSSEFGRKDKATIETEEFLKSKSPDIAKNIRSGDIVSARAAFAKLSEKMKDDEKSALQKGLEKMIAGQVDTMSKAEDIPGLKKLFTENKLEEIGIENLSSLPKEFVQEPEFQNKLKDTLANKFRGDLYGAGEFVRTSNKLIESGWMSPQAVGELISSPEYQGKIQKDLAKTFHGDLYGAGEFVKGANEYVRMKLLTPEALSKIIASDEYQGKIQKDLAKTFHGDLYSAGEFVKGANEYVRMNLLTPQSLSRIIASEEYQNKIQKDLTKLFRNGDDYGKQQATEAANEYVRFGLITKEKASQVIANLRAKKVA